MENSKLINRVLRLISQFLVIKWIKIEVFVKEADRSLIQLL